MDKQQALEQYFGYKEFRGGQEQLIDAQLAGREVFGIMPTGGGKSLCYQIPALLLPGITLVVSPLISLMHDQVMALKACGVAAAYVNSSLTYEQRRLVFRRMAAGAYKIVYIAPERLLLESFLTLARSLPIRLLAVDEAHCISQWGQDFRPSYLKIVEFLEQLGYRPIVSAFTATATEAVRQDVERILQMKDPVRVVTGFDRKNLHFSVRNPKDKKRSLIALLQARAKLSGIVYCATRKDVEELCRELQGMGLPATRYHAGLTEEERKKNQEDFVYDRQRIMVATNAFGMGIDKSNVSYVIHYSLPKSIEAYYQEAGRAGRDGSPAECILLYHPRDVQTAKFLIETGGENEALTPEEREKIRQQDLKRLYAMIGYCKSLSCLRGYILGYFGQKHDPACNNCGNCAKDTVERDITTEARMILSCVQRIYRHLHYNLGITLVMQVLRGSRVAKVKQLGLDSLSTYGLMQKTPEPELREMIESLEGQGYLHTDPAHGALRLTERAAEVLFHEGTVVMLTHKERSQEPEMKPNRPLFEVLKELRLKLSLQEKVPAYIILNNNALEDLARKAPRSREELLNVSGIGMHKAERYGEAFLKAIDSYYGGK